MSNWLPPLLAPPSNRLLAERPRLTRAARGGVFVCGARPPHTFSLSAREQHLLDELRGSKGVRLKNCGDNTGRAK